MSREARRPGLRIGVRRFDSSRGPRQEALPQVPEGASYALSAGNRPAAEGRRTTESSSDGPNGSLPAAAARCGQYSGRVANENVEIARGYHERTKHSEERLRANPHHLDWDNQPVPFKLYRDLETIPLPRQLEPGTVSALRAISALVGRETDFQRASTTSARTTSRFGACVSVTTEARSSRLPASSRRWLRPRSSSRAPRRTGATPGSTETELTAMPSGTVERSTRTCLPWPPPRDSHPRSSQVSRIGTSSTFSDWIRLGKGLLPSFHSGEQPSRQCLRRTPPC